MWKQDRRDVHARIYISETMSIAKRTITTLTTFAAACALVITVAPMASADSTEAVTSIRSFPKVTEVQKDLFAEAMSTEVSEDADWGGIEELDVPQTKSQAEKDAEAAAAAAQAAAEAAAAQAAAAQVAQQQTAAASRSEERESLNQAAAAPVVSTPLPSGEGGSAVASYAMQFVGVAPYMGGGTTPAGWDCSGFVQYVFAQFGVSLPRTSGAQATVGVAVPSLAEAVPGDIIANGSHAGIYIGNGMVVNAMNPGQGTGTLPVSWAYVGSYSIRRVL